MSEYSLTPPTSCQSVNVPSVTGRSMIITTVMMIPSWTGREQVSHRYQGVGLVTREGLVTRGRRLLPGGGACYQGVGFVTREGACNQGRGLSPGGGACNQGGVVTPMYS